MCKQDLAHGLEELLSYEGNVEEDFYLTFQVPGYILSATTWAAAATTHSHV